MGPKHKLYLLDLPILYLRYSPTRYSLLEALVNQSKIPLSEGTMKFWRALATVVWFTFIFDSASSLAVDESRFLDWQVAIPHEQSDTSGGSPGFVDTDLPAYSDTLGTWEKCHCNQNATVSRDSFLTNKSFGTCSKCHYKLGVTENGVTVTGDICIITIRSTYNNLCFDVN